MTSSDSMAKIARTINSTEISIAGLRMKQGTSRSPGQRGGWPGADAGGGARGASGGTRASRSNIKKPPLRLPVGQVSSLLGQVSCVPSISPTLARRLWIPPKKPRCVPSGAAAPQCLHPDRPSSTPPPARTTSPPSIAMTVTMPPESSPRHGLKLPHPPPLLHTRSGNESFDRPATPTDNGFTSPAQTPQGSPSKNRMPPGALELPGVFDKAMKLSPSSPTKSGYGTPPVLSPAKSAPAGGDEDVDFSESVIRQPSPTRKSNKDKENTPPGAVRAIKELGPRHEHYQNRESGGARRTQTTIRGLTAEELEKLQLPKVKRLANVTQLCTPPLFSPSPEVSDCRYGLTVPKISSTTTLTSSATSTTARTVRPSSTPPTRRPPPRPSKNMRLRDRDTLAASVRTCANAAPGCARATSRS